MNPAEHLVVLVSIILGLGITDLLTSVRQLVRARNRVRFHWLPLTWAAIVFLAIVQFWWAFFGIVQADIWRSYFAYAFLLLGPVVWYLIASSVLPDLHGEASVDLEAYYFEERRWVFLLLTLVIILGVISELLRGHAFLEQARILQGTFVALFLLLAWTRSARLHAVATAAVLLLLVVFVVLYSLRIP